MYAKIKQDDSILQKLVEFLEKYKEKNFFSNEDLAAKLGKNLTDPPQPMIAMPYDSLAEMEGL